MRNLQIGNCWWKLCAAVLLLGVALWPRHAEAIVYCSSPMNTSVLTGSGLTCAAAQSNLSSLTLSQANSICASQGYGGVCTSTLNYVTACTDIHRSDGTYTYVRSGYRTFTCTECTLSNPCP